MGGGGSLPGGSGGQGARLGSLGARNGAVIRAARSRSLVLPVGDVNPAGEPLEQRVLRSAFVAAARRVGGMHSACM